MKPAYLPLFIIIVSMLAAAQQKPPSVQAAAARSTVHRTDKDVGALFDDCCIPADSVFPQLALIADHCTIITNGRFFMPLCHPAPAAYDFAGADRIASFAHAHGLKMRGHTLLWHEQVPDWLAATRLTRDQAAQLVRSHIQKVVSRYAGRMYAWDVVNEAVDDDAHLRDSGFANILGPDYIADAFRWSHEADPQVLLFYNDYGIEEKNAKSDAVYELLSGLLARKVPVHGVGFQCHFSVDDPPDFGSMRENIARFARLGLTIHFTEIDVRGKVPFTKETLSRQSAIYRGLGRLFAEEPACRAAVFWVFPTAPHGYRERLRDTVPLALLTKSTVPNPLSMSSSAIWFRAIRPCSNRLQGRQLMGADLPPFLSIIVIGRNQRDAVVRCCTSAVEAVRAADITRHELLYVDSNSSDDTVEALRTAFGSTVTSLRLQGAVSAAIGRNAGADAARGNVFFFIDGDCEIDPDFLPNVYSNERGLLWPLVSGGLRELLYDAQGAQKGEITDRYGACLLRRDRDLGGIFLIEARLFRSAGGFDNRYRSSEEMDLMVRLASKGVMVTRFPRRIATHHTIDYFALPRIVSRFFSGVHRFDGLLYREHLSNPIIWRLIARQQRFSFILLGALALALAVNPFLVALYPLSIIAKYRRHPSPGYLCHVSQTFLRDAAIAWGFVAFFPRRDNESHKRYAIVR